MSALSFALLLQAAADEVGEIDPTTAEEVAIAIDQSTLLSLLLQVGPVGFTVFGILAVMSVWSWALAFSKHRVLSRAARFNAAFLRTFRRVGNLVELNSSTESYRPSPLVTVFDFGYAEVAR